MIVEVGLVTHGSRFGDICLFGGCVLVCLEQPVCLLGRLPARLIRTLDCSRPSRCMVRLLFLCVSTC